uniref:NADH-ubiquinone oxidoreductase chain 6 n=1 Tax=Forcipiger flavissimus TaxID=109909 RepID=A0A8K1NVL6_FORFL|nr:NADH dehydrogenase subunit 6 [Forcipiger flavissimus]UDF87738.1 NADH dehydrogenase subunit 6 [Forcipiger flavissimus]
MSYVIVLSLIGLVVGLMAVASNPSPFFGALGLVVVAGFGCLVLVGHGGSFLPLVLFLVYLGGMLVVFAYSAALAADPHPEGWDNREVALHLVLYSSVVLPFCIFFCLYGGWYEFSEISADESAEFTMSRADVGSVALMYSLGGEMLIISAWVLLLTLFVVLELTRGLSRGALRAI